MSIVTRIKDCIDNHDEYVATMAAMPDKELVKKLDVINMQAVIAHQTNNTASAELLEIWWRQVVEARIYKAENNIPDALNEIQEAIKDIETYVAKTEERQEILQTTNITVRKLQPAKNVKDENQLGLF